MIESGQVLVQVHFLNNGLFGTVGVVDSGRLDMAHLVVLR